MKAPTLKRRSQFLELRQNGVFRRGVLMDLRAVVSDSQGLPKFGLATSKKLGSAVTRNRIRRRLRSAIVESGVLGMEHEDLYLFIPGDKCLMAPYTEIVKEVAKLVSAARQIRRGRG